MSAVKYLLDENVDRRLQRALLRQSPDMIVWCVGGAGAPPAGTLDPAILIWCEASGFTLVTNNRASMPVHLREHLAAGRHVPGIFILNAHMTFVATVDELATIWGASEAEEYRDLLIYLPLSS
ncbi:MAG: DUF5615 family PIN-like protein [Chloroflexi bacterium]|nr:DUF5615 family PIN-like protein [Chloroflexota bacterium]